MPAQPVIAADVLAGFIRTRFTETYERLINDVNARLNGVMEFGLPSDRSNETYAYFTSAPHPKRWVRGEDIPTEAFEDITFNVVNHDWAIGIEWHENDRMDDQTASLMRRAREAATGFALLRERVFFQLLQGQTDPDLLPNVPLAPDGVAFFSTTDALGAARFGATSGNLITGTGVATAGDIRNDFFNAVEQYHLFQDTKGQPLWPEAILDIGYTVLMSVTNLQVFTEGLVQGRTLQTFSSIAPSAGVAAGAVTNVVLDSGMNLTLWPTQRIADNDFYIFATGAPTKAVFEQVRQPVVESTQLPENSDIARRTKIEGIFWNARYGFGISLPYQGVKVNNP